LSPTPPAAPEWGVIVSADKTLAPAYDGGPSAEWEPVRLWRLNYKGAVLFYHGTHYWTVVPEPDQGSAETTVKKFKANPPYEHWADATVVHVSNWCPLARLDRTFQVAKATMTLFDCGPAQSK
jgi:hypothetical protein